MELFMAFSPGASKSISMNSATGSIGRSSVFIALNEAQ